MKQTVPQSEEFETRATDLVIRLVFLGLFAYLSFGLLRPFVSIFVWAVILTVALFPVYRSLGAALGGRRGLAATLVTLITLAILLGPLGPDGKSCRNGGGAGGRHPCRNASASQTAGLGGNLAHDRRQAERRLASGLYQS
jgi:hypothetical protein